MLIKRIIKLDKDLIEELNKVFVKGAEDGKSGYWNLENATKFIINPNNIFLLAYIDNKIAGMISAYKLQRMDSRGCEMFFYEIGVKKEFRQRGVGKELVEKLKNLGKKMKIDEIFVFTNRSNKAAMKLYTSTGGKISNENDEVMFTYKLRN